MSILHGEGNAAHSGILAWKIPWAEEPGGLQLTGWRRVGRTRGTERTILYGEAEALRADANLPTAEQQLS